VTTEGFNTNIKYSQKQRQKTAKQNKTKQNKTGNKGVKVRYKNSIYIVSLGKAYCV